MPQIMSEYLIKVLATQEGIAKVTKDCEQLGTAIQKVDKVTQANAASAKKATGIMGEMGLAFRRALIVAPVWMATRAVMMEFLGVLNQGLESLKSFDAQLMKSKQVIHGYAGTATQAIGELAPVLEQMAIDFGIPLEKVTSSFYRFGTVGIEMRKGLEGVAAASKLANLNLGDSDKIAEVLAMTYKLLGDRISSVIKPGEEMNLIAAKMYKLWRFNAGEVNDYAEALQKFLPVAKTAGFTLEQTLALLGTLQTAGLKGGRAGTLLRTSIAQLVKNMGIAKESLNLEFKPSDDMFTRLLKIIEALKNIEKQGKILQAQDIIGKIFGGVRGKEPIAGFVAIWEVLQQSIKTGIIDDATKQMSEFNKEAKDVEGSINKQIAAIEELKKKIGRNFWEGMFGTEAGQQTDKFNERFERTKNILDSIVTSAKVLGQTIMLPFEGYDIIGQILGEGLVYNHAQTLGQGSQNDQRTIQKAQMAEAKLAAEKLKRQLAENKQQKQKSVLGLTLGPAPIDEKALKTADKLAEKFLDTIIDGQNDLAKAAGLPNSKIIKQQIELEKTLNINQDIINLAKREYDLQAAITEERKKQKTFTSEDLKLMQIALRYGPNVAKKIQSALTDPTALEKLFEPANPYKGGEYDPTGKGLTQRIFKKEFGSEYEQYLAEQFYGNKGRFKGKGGNKLQTEAQQAQINTNVAIYLDGKEITASTVKKIVDEIRNPSSKLYSELTKHEENTIENY